MNADVPCHTAARTIEVLIRLAAGPRSAPELAEILDVAKPTVRRILGLLTQGGYVERLPHDAYHKRYRLTRRCQLLGHQIATVGHGECGNSDTLAARDCARDATPLRMQGPALRGRSGPPARRASGSHIHEVCLLA